jgi:hypothetical protein
MRKERVDSLLELPQMSRLLVISTALNGLRESNEGGGGLGSRSGGVCPSAHPLGNCRLTAFTGETQVYLLY